MTIVHYYLGRPARIWIAANTRRSPGQPARGSTPSVPAAGGLGPARAQVAELRLLMATVPAPGDPRPAG